MNRAVGAWLCICWHIFLGLCPGFTPGWYELPPLASPGTIDDKCPNSIPLKRPDRRRAEAALWRAAKAEGRAPTNRQLLDARLSALLLLPYFQLRTSV